MLVAMEPVWLLSMESNRISALPYRLCQVLYVQRYALLETMSAKSLIVLGHKRPKHQGKEYRKC